jgi:hypothetical protein
MALSLTEEVCKQLQALNVLPYSPQKAKHLFSLPQNEDDWLHERKIRCTASEIGKVAGLSEYGNTEQALKNKFINTPPTESMKRGLLYEPFIMNNYQNHLKVCLICLLKPVVA